MYLRRCVTKYYHNIVISVIYLVDNYWHPESCENNNAERDSPALLPPEMSLS